MSPLCRAIRSPMADKPVTFQPPAWAGAASCRAWLEVRAADAASDAAPADTVRVDAKPWTTFGSDADAADVHVDDRHARSAPAGRARPGREGLRRAVPRAAAAVLPGRETAAASARGARQPSVHARIACNAPPLTRARTAQRCGAAARGARAPRRDGQGVHDSAHRHARHARGQPAHGAPQAAALEGRLPVRSAARC